MAKSGKCSCRYCQNFLGPPSRPQLLLLRELVTEFAQLLLVLSVAQRSLIDAACHSADLPDPVEQISLSSSRRGRIGKAQLLLQRSLPPPCAFCSNSAAWCMLAIRAMVGTAPEFFSDIPFPSLRSSLSFIRLGWVPS